MSELGGLDTRVLYTGLVGLVAALRLAELALSNRNTRRALAAGAVEEGAGHYPAMVTLHTAFLLACPLEVWALGRPFVPALAAPMLALFVAAMGLRYWVIATLGGRWTTRIVCFPGRPLVTSGPYRVLRHPNYVAVGIEILALPLIHGAWLTAVVFCLANLALLRVRIRAEEAALARHAPREVAGGR